MLYRISEYLDDMLRNDEWEGIDGSTNGIQVENSGDVSKVAFAVDASIQTIETANEENADMLVTHHGIIWGGIDRVTGQEYARIRRLVESDMALYASHLPLDAHERIGNNVLLLKQIDATPQETFGAVGGQDVGYVGRLPSPMEFDELVYEIEDAVG
ncbi:MAG: Nif3-like dinuclear metal center hexameric protein, partial [Halobacteria archaeon]|nr:Nif3-like dinuclear metal center hexameric protein [Halobacteria archaeon]